MDMHMRDRVKRCIVQILTFILLCVPGPLYASNYEWVQSDWSGGADTSAVAIHPDDQTEWNRFYSKDPYVRTSIPGEASIFPQPASIIQTADLNDFDRGTLTNTLRLVGNGGYRNPDFYRNAGDLDWSEIQYIWNCRCLFRRGLPGEC